MKNSNFWINFAIKSGLWLAGLIIILGIAITIFGLFNRSIIITIVGFCIFYGGIAIWDATKNENNDKGRKNLQGI